MASVTGAKSRRKGHDFERRFCRWVRDELGVACGRNLKQYGEAQEGDTDPVGGFLPECKNCARLSLKAWWQQACVQAKKRGLVPLLVYNVPRQGMRFRIPTPNAPEDAPWRHDFEFTHDVGPAEMALILRERL